MSEHDAPKALSELVEPGTTLMVATRGVAGVESRPLTVAEVEGSRLSILIDTTADWSSVISSGDWTLVTISDTRDNDFASMTGTLSVDTDPARIDDLWNPFADAYFPDGRESPGIAILDVSVEAGSYWDSPSGRLGSMISLVKAKLGSAEQSGDHGEIAVE